VIRLLDAAARQRESLERTDHRPWPLPDRSWVQGQTWERLLFAHWRVPEEALRTLLPPELPLDTHDGSAWIGVTPFRVTGFRLRGLPPLPLLSTFPELNVRTYVTVDAKPGIFFFSLDAASPLAVEAARRTYKLPYFHARMSAGEDGDWTTFVSERRSADDRARRFAFRGRYRPTGPAREPLPGSLEDFLTERYCLYVLDERRAVERRAVERGDIHHRPWQLREAEAEISENTMLPDGIEAAAQEPLLHYAERQDTVIWSLVPAPRS
jgi:uncharacterized protein YqjF (DUF2071 family)